MSQSHGIEGGTTGEAFQEQCLLDIFNFQDILHVRTYKTLMERETMCLLIFLPSPAFWYFHLFLIYIPSPSCFEALWSCFLYFPMFINYKTVKLQLMQLE